MGTPASVEPASPREKHLAKAKPPALGARGPGGPDLGATDPNLKKFQQAGGGGGLRTLLIVLIFVIIAAVLLVVLTLFVPAVRALLPLGLQQKIEQAVGGPPATQLPEPPATTAPVTPAPVAPASTSAKPKPAPVESPAAVTTPTTAPAPVAAPTTEAAPVTEAPRAP